MPFLFGRGTRTVLLVDEISPCLAFKGFGFRTGKLSDPRIKAGYISAPWS